MRTILSIRQLTRALAVRHEPDTSTLSLLLKYTDRFRQAGFLRHTAKTKGRGILIKISITGRQIETGKALRTHVVSRLTSAVEKYFNRSADVNVVFSRQEYDFESNFLLSRYSGFYLYATVNDTDI